MTASIDPTAAEARSARRALGALFFLLGASNASWIARIPALRDGLELGDRDLGLLLLAPAAGAMIAFRFAGRLTARFGSRLVAQVSTVSICAFMVLPALAPTPLLAALALGAFGAANGMMDVSLNAHGVELERHLGRPILGSLHGLCALGRLAGATGAAVAAWQGMPPVLHLLVAAIAFEGVFAVLGRDLLRGRPPAPRAEAPGAEVPAREGPATARRTGILVALGVVCFCSSASEGSMAEWSGVYLRDALGASEALAASAYAVFSLTLLVSRFAGDRLTLRFGAVGIVRYGGLLIAISLAAGLAIDTRPAMLAAFACVGVGVATLVPTAFRAGTLVPGISQGAALATLAMVSYTAFFVGPSVIGAVSEQVTLRVALLIVTGLGLVLAVIAPVVERAGSSAAAWSNPARPAPRPAPEA